MSEWIYRLAEYNTCEKLYQTIVETLQQRNNQPKNSDEYSRISARIRVQLKQYSNQVNQLKVQLQNVASSNSLYPLLKKKKKNHLGT